MTVTSNMRYILEVDCQTHVLKVFFNLFVVIRNKFSSTIFIWNKVLTVWLTLTNWCWMLRSHNGYHIQTISSIITRKCSSSSRFSNVCVFPLCRWNVVGIQGSLMSYFTEPIYFSSIILGSLYHADHLSRAMYQRIADIEDLPQQFTLNRPLLSGQCRLRCGNKSLIRVLLKFELKPWLCSHFQCFEDTVVLIFANRTAAVKISKRKMVILSGKHIHPPHWSVHSTMTVIAFLLCLISADICLVPVEFE